MNFITIDPGLNSLGYAIFDIMVRSPIAAGLIKPNLKPSDDILHRANDMAKQVVLIANHMECKRGLIEYPKNMMSGAGLAANASGDIIKLATCVGAIAGQMAAYDIPSHAVPVNEWKGQLPKYVVIKRIRDMLGEATCTKLELKHDMWDAVGIGLYHKGFFK